MTRSNNSVTNGKWAIKLPRSANGTTNGISRKIDDIRAGTDGPLPFSIECDVYCDDDDDDDVGLDDGPIALLNACRR
jgi:hypothetical protein